MSGPDKDPHCFRLKLHAGVICFSVTTRSVCPTKHWASWDIWDDVCLAYHQSPSSKHRIWQRVNVPQIPKPLNNLWGKRSVWQLEGSGTYRQRGNWTNVGNEQYQKLCDLHKFQVDKLSSGGNPFWDSGSMSVMMGNVGKTPHLHVGSTVFASTWKPLCRIPAHCQATAPKHGLSVVLTHYMGALCSVLPWWG